MAKYLREAGEWLPLNGLGGVYIGFHCLQTIDAIDLEATDQAVRARKGISFSTPTFVPTLQRDRVPDNCHVFRVPQSFQKVFVGAQFKAAYESSGLLGLDFLLAPMV